MFGKNKKYSDKMIKSCKNYWFLQASRRCRNSERSLELRKYVPGQQKRERLKNGVENMKHKNCQSMSQGIKNETGQLVPEQKCAASGTPDSIFWKHTFRVIEKVSEKAVQGLFNYKKKVFRVFSRFWVFRL